MVHQGIKCHFSLNYPYVALCRSLVTEGNLVAVVTILLVVMSLFYADFAHNPDGLYAILVPVPHGHDHGNSSDFPVSDSTVSG